MAGLVNLNILINIPRCVSLAVGFDLLSFYFLVLFKFGWLTLLQHPTCNQAVSSFMALEFVALKIFISTCPRPTDIELLKFRLTLCPPYLFRLFQCIHLKSEWDVKCTNSQILNQHQLQLLGGGKYSTTF